MGLFSESARTTPKTMKKISTETAKAVHIYLVKEGIYLDERQAEQVALAVDAEMLPLYEAARCAMQRMETIRETNPEIALDDDIERLRRALDSENVKREGSPSQNQTEAKQ